MITESTTVELLIVIAASVSSTIGAMYRLFVPRGESVEYRAGIDDQKKRIERRIDAVEFSLSRMVTRETLDDVLGPVKSDLTEIKHILREKR